MGTQQQFCLRWNNHQVNLLSVFDILLQNESFVDVTLACDGYSLKAHRVVLSACSPYFQKLFLDNPHPHPVVILADVHYADLKALVDFMYKGEVNVLQDQLQELLKTAELLKIKGLSEVSPTSSTLGANINQKNSNVAIKEIVSESVQLCATVTPVTPVNASTTPNYSPSSKRKRVKQQHKSGSASENEDSILEMNGPPEAIESRVDVPRNSRNVNNDTNRPSRCNVNNGLRVSKDEDSDDTSDPGIPEQSVHEGFSQENDDMMNTPCLDPPTLLGITQDYSSPPHQFNSSLPSGLSSDLSDATLEDGNKNNMSRNEDYNELATISTSITATQNLTASTMAATQEHCDPERKAGGHSNLGSQWTTNDMGHTLESIRNGRVTLTKASAMYSLPSTPLWQRVKREGIDANKRDFTIASNWTEEDLHQALEAIRTGRLSITKAAVTFGIPNTTLWQRSRKDGIDTSRMSGGTHQSNYTEANLSQALDAIGMGRMSVNKASSTFGIPSSTLWSRAKRYGIETGRKRLWDQDRDEVMWQALQAVKAGAISMTQASIKFNVPYTTLWNHFKKWEMSTGLSLSNQSVPVSTASSSSAMSMNMTLPPPTPLTSPHHHLPPSNNSPMGIGQHGGIPMISQHHSVPHPHQHPHALPHPHPIENIIPDNSNNNSMNS